MTKQKPEKRLGAAEPAVAADAGPHGFAHHTAATYFARPTAAFPARLNSQMLYRTPLLPSADAHLRPQTRATRALLKFCEDHGRDGAELEPIRACLASLETGDVAEAVRAFERVPLGGNGCFNDWWPPVAFEHETEEYVWAVFEALVGEWSRAMALSAQHRAV